MSRADKPARGGARTVAAPSPGALPRPESWKVKEKIARQMGKFSSLLASGAIVPPGYSSLESDRPSIGPRLHKKR